MEKSKKIFKEGTYVHGKSFKELGREYRHASYSRAGVALYIENYLGYDNNAQCWKMKLYGGNGWCTLLESEVREWDKVRPNREIEEYEIY